jgi:hypothetical protein
MAIILLLMSLGAAVVGIQILSVAKNAVHEIEAGICFLSAAVCFSGFGVVYAIDRVHRTLAEPRPAAPEGKPPEKTERVLDALMGKPRPRPHPGQEGGHAEDSTHGAGD